MTESKSPIRIFIAYSQNDKDLLAELKKHLEMLRLGQPIDVWDDGQILPGMDWEKAVSDAMYESDLILLLVSVDFIVSDFCYNQELRIAMELQKIGRVQVIPLIMRHCLWEITPVAELQVLPEKGIPVTDNHWQSTDEAFTEIIRDLDKSLRQIIENRKMKAEQAIVADRLMKEKQLFYEKIHLAEQLFVKENYTEAAHKYREASTFYRTGFMSSLEQLSNKIALCEQKIIEAKPANPLVSKEKRVVSVTKKITKKTISPQYVFGQSPIKEKKKKRTKGNSKRQIVFMFSVSVFVFVAFVIWQIFIKQETIDKQSHKLNTKKEIVEIDKKITKNNEQELVERIKKIEQQALVFMRKGDYGNTVKLPLPLLSESEKRQSDTLFQAQVNEFQIRFSNELYRNIQSKIRVYTQQKEYEIIEHRYFETQLALLLNVDYLAPKRILFVGLYKKINDLYVDHYIRYANGLVRRNQLDEAIKNLDYVATKMKYSTTEQQQKLAGKKIEIEKLRNILQNF